MAAAKRAADGILLRIKVVPGSSRAGIAGWLGDALKVRVTAPAERGRANASVEEVVAAALGLPRASVRVVTGTTSPRKTLEIRGASESWIRERLGPPRGDR
jgi:hypothetical protein